MEFFDKLGKKASEAYKVTADKTGKLAKEAKLRVKISDLKNQVKEVYEEIGKKVYEKYTKEEGIDIKTELEPECTKIDVLNAEIENNLDECLELKDKKMCTKCSAQIDKNVKFCPECGEKQEEEQVKEVEILENKDCNCDKECSCNDNKCKCENEDSNIEKTVEVESNPDLD